MKVKIGTSIFESNDIPILLILTPEEKELISNMGDQTKFCSYPEDLVSQKDVLRFMKEI